VATGAPTMHGNRQMTVGPVSLAVGRRIRQLRIEAGLSPGRLARQAGLKVSALLSIEEGRTPPTLTMLGDLVSHLGVSLSQLVREAKRSSGAVEDRVKSTPEQIGRAIVELPEGFHKLRIAEAAAIRFALEVCDGNQSAAARLLGMPRKSMLRRAKGLAAR
jgi:transcriptional regulator with XRE-family HTH domain